jgi:uncharacterized coiled-coil protein SlyX
VKQLSAENSQVVSALNDTRAQIAALSTKLDSLPQLAAPQPVVHAKPHPAPMVRRAPVPRHDLNDVRFTRLQSQIDDQGKAIDATRQELSSARTELQGGIARNHEELITLQKKGERNYFEFNLDKSKQFQRTGPVSISLRKANTKHMYADLEIRVGDSQVQQKHVNLYQPVMFYAEEQGRPIELVINSIVKDHIRGYISAPRYSATELTASGADGNGKRQKLEVPQ